MLYYNINNVKGSDMEKDDLLTLIARVAAAPSLVGLGLLHVGFGLDISLLWIIGLVIFAVSMSVIIYCIIILSRTDRKNLRQGKECSCILKSKISDYVAEINGIKSRYFADVNADKNIVPKPHFQYADRFTDYSVLKNGQIYYGCMVQSNDKMSEASSETDELWTATFVYSRDEYFVSNPLELIKIARKLFSNGENNKLRSETKYEFNKVLDTALTDGKEIFMTDMLLYGEHLPLGGRGAGQIMPIIANPDTSDSAFVVDCKYWSDSLIYDYIHNPIRTELEESCGNGT